VLGVLLLVQILPWGHAWLTGSHQLPKDKVQFLDRALDDGGGVSARTAQGAMTTLRREDIRKASFPSCSREYTCRKSTRSGCVVGAISFYCTYDVKHRSGHSATAIVKVDPNDGHDRRLQPYRVQTLPLQEADSKLCALGSCGARRK
jgi:hypothetical protein